MTEISKAYEPQAVEEKWYAFWLKQNCFTANAKSLKPAFSIVIPPPNVTGMLHMGHVLNNTIQDILSRKARMDGKEVLWLPGTDHAGIATQVQVEKALKKEERKTKYDLGREEFLKRVWAWKEKHGGIIINQLKKLGCSCDWTRERFTMDPEYSRCVQKVFVELYKKGLIYRGKRMVNWCPVSQTALSDEEVEMKPQKGFMYHFKVQVAEPGSAGVPPASAHEPKLAAETAALPGPDGHVWLTIATTRPETIPGDTAVAVNPKDLRYAHLIGKHVIRPLPIQLPSEKKIIPIIGDEHVDFEFGTGVLKVTPAHDKADFEIGQRHNLPIVDIMNPNGTMNDLAGESLAGLDRFEARDVAVERLKELSVLVEEKPYEHNVGFSQRADVPIEPRLSEQWFLKYPSVPESKTCVAQDGYQSARNLDTKKAQIVHITGTEISGGSIRELRKAALAYAKKQGFIGQPYRNEDSSLQIRIGRQSLSHAFSNLGAANMLAVAALPELIRTAIWISSEPHEPINPMIRKVHRLVAALSIAGELHSVLITGKEFSNGTILYDHKARKIALGGKSLEAHLPKEKLDTQPAPNASIKLPDLLENVNPAKMHFHPQRWAKVYDHWLTNIQDWCISRQLWWGHRIPVWTKRANYPNDDEVFVSVHYPDDPKTGIFTSQIPGIEGEISFQANKLAEGNGYELRALTFSSNAAAHLEKHGFTQDPDVLDTWFSSWLWPFATMGWPEQTETLKKFYPTRDLVTGPDIIFFWVARMIMAGYEFMGDMPFRNVYFTGIIRDKQGRKMSKTLGNSPDPLDLIARYGADALRFGTMRSAPLGQDVLFDEKDVELGRNFCNKLWNACRFRQMQSQSAADVSPADQTQGENFRQDAGSTFDVQGEINPQLLSSDDKWILLKLDAAIREITEALNTYNFSTAVQALYRFFWSEYCDWYVEASKAVLHGGDSARKANTLAVIDFVLSHTLRLFHPFLPFITEELWHGMGYAEDMPDDQGGETIMYAHWPKPLDEDFKGHYGLDDCYLDMVNAKYDLVTQGRNLRRAGNISASKKVKYIFKPVNFTPPQDLEVIKLLLNAEALEVNENYQAPKGTPTARTELGELCLPLEGLVDVAAEKIRLTKEREKLKSDIVKTEQKLANPNFVQKALPQVLAEHQQRALDLKAKLDHVLEALKALEG